VCLLALAGVLGVGKGHLLHRKTHRVESGYFANIRKFSWIQRLRIKVADGFIK
jgi:hypothetical protein